MRQRVSVARALAMSPRVLLLDEPLSALDALTRATLQDEISDIWLKNKTTVIWITNDPDEAILLAERGPKAVELAYRGGEIKNGNPVFPSEGTVRGGPDFKDWYYFSGIHATFKINDPTFGSKNRLKGSKTSCPGPVY
jgi:Fe-S cluster assembly ATPase SufC